MNDAEMIKEFCGKGGKCIWKPAELSQSYMTACGKLIINDGRYLYCAFCGKRIVREEKK